MRHRVQDDAHGLCSMLYSMPRKDALCRNAIFPFSPFRHDRSERKMQFFPISREALIYIYVHTQRTLVVRYLQNNIKVVHRMISTRDCKCYQKIYVYFWRQRTVVSVVKQIQYRKYLNITEIVQSAAWTPCDKMYSTIKYGERTRTWLLRTIRERSIELVKRGRLLSRHTVYKRLKISFYRSHSPPSSSDLNLHRRILYRSSRLPVI